MPESGYNTRVQDQACCYLTDALLIELQRFEIPLKHYYRPQIKSWKGNVFTGMCLFTGGVGNASLDKSQGREPSHTPPDMGPGYLPPSPPGHRTWHMGTYPSPY